MPAVGNTAEAEHFRALARSEVREARYDVRSTDDVGVSGQLRGQQYRVQRGLAGGQDVDAFVEVAVGRRRADRVVRGQLYQPGVVQEPPQHQDRLLEAAQGASATAGTAPGPFGVE